MKNIQKIFDAIYELLLSEKAIKASSVGTHDDTILVTVGRKIYEITVKEILP